MASLNKWLGIDERLRDLYVDRKMSIPLVAKETGLPMSTVRNRLIKLCTLRTRKEGIRQAATEGRMSHAKGSKRTFSDEWRENIRLAQLARAEKHAVGFSVKPNGYVEVTRGENKFRPLHVVIMEEHLGRRMTADEVVHHIDGNRSHNSIENLQVMTRSEHSRLHALENLTKRKRNEYGQFK